jgi:1-deoxy-D-xylulose-5-phosphate synthase
MSETPHTLEILPRIVSPFDLRTLSEVETKLLATEIRETLCRLVSHRTAHFASNLGVVELCIALHQVFDFSNDRLIWDTGHQIYPHKLVTGRYHEFESIRQKNGLMGYPNPSESPYDLFMTGHAGSSISTVLGLKAADDLISPTKRRSVAVIGDGALPSGIVFEAFNNASGLNKDLLVILNDNKMGICPRVGGLGKYLDRARLKTSYTHFKRDLSKLLKQIPLIGNSMQRGLAQIKEAMKAYLHGGMLFEELGFRYVGPIDGHDLKSLREYLEMVKDIEGPVLLHVFTEKGHGFAPACENPVLFHAPPPFERQNEDVITIKKSSSRAYTDSMSDCIRAAMHRDPNVAVITAAMCEGNKLNQVRAEFPSRFFDVGICEGHAVAFAGGMAKAGMRPIVDIYSTFLQRSFDQIFQEAALQNLPVTFCLDRAGLCGPDGPTHHGSFDNSYMRIFPNMVLVAPGDEQDVGAMLDFALSHNGPVSIRYPKCNVETIVRPNQAVELGQSEVHSWGRDGMLIGCGTMFINCVKAANELRKQGLDVGVINARFIKPLDETTFLKAIQDSGFVITVEENTLIGGFGSAVLEMANDHGVNTSHIRRLGIPDRFIMHGERSEQLTEIGLDVAGIVTAAKEMSQRHDFTRTESRAFAS